MPASKFAAGRPLQQGTSHGSWATAAGPRASGRAHLPASPGAHGGPSFPGPAPSVPVVNGHLSSDAFSMDDEKRSTKPWWAETNDAVAELALLRHVIFFCRRSSNDKIVALTQDCHVRVRRPPPHPVLLLRMFGAVCAYAVFDPLHRRLRAQLNFSASFATGLSTKTALALCRYSACALSRLVVAFC